MQTVCFLLDRDRALKNTMDLLLEAKKIVYISTSEVDFDVLLPVLNKICNNSCTVNILLSDLMRQGSTILGPSSGENQVQGRGTDPSPCPCPCPWPKLPQNCNVKFAKRLGPLVKDEFLPYTPLVQKLLSEYEDKDEQASKLSLSLKTPIYQHNQSYVLIDSNIFLIGANLFSKPTSATAFHLHAPLCVMRSSLDDDKSGQGFVQALATQNWSSNGWANYEDFDFEKEVCNMISKATHYCYVETPLFLSTESTENKIADALVSRLIQKDSDFDDFKCVILVNRFHKQDELFESRKHIGKKLNYTLEYIVKRLEQETKLPAVAFREKLFIGYLKQSSIQSTIIVQDGKQCLISTASLNDRSKKNCELTMPIFELERIESLQHLLWSQHVGKEDLHTFSDFFEHCLEESGKIRRHKLWSPKQADKFQTTDFLYETLLGQCYYI